MRLPMRRTLWFSAALLLTAVVAGPRFMPRSKVTQENYNRITHKMTIAEVIAILGEPDPDPPVLVPLHAPRGDGELQWSHGPDKIAVYFDSGRVLFPRIHMATAWESTTWYAKKVAKKIGVTWQ